MTPEIIISYYKDKSEIRDLIEKSSIFSENIKPSLIQAIDSEQNMGIIFDNNYKQPITICFNKKEFNIVR